MKRRDEIADKSSCLNRSVDNEPLFVLCARDGSAPMVVRVWAEAYRERKGGDMRMTDAEKAKYQEALACATQMEHWRETSRYAVKERA